MQGRRQGTYEYAWAAGLVLLVLAVFGQALGFPFVEYDDNLYVTRNPLVGQGLSVEGVLRVFREPLYGLYHPLAWLSHMLDVEVFGFNAAGHHYVSLGLHVANVLLLFYLLRQATGAEGRSAVAAALFAVHPLHVEPVVWIASRKDVLSTLFWLAALLTYARHRGTLTRRDRALLFAWTLLALLAKPMAVALPLTLLLLDYWPLRRHKLLGEQPAWAAWAPRLREKAGLLVLCGAFAALALYAARGGGSLRSLQDVSAADRFLRPPVHCVEYLAKTFWPAGLTANYPLDSAPVAPLAGLGALGLLAAISAATVALARRAPYLAMGWGWFLATLLPVIGFVPVGDHSLADRYTYVPLIGVFAALTWGAADLLARLRRRGLAPAVAAAVLVPLACTAWVQARTWRSTEALFAHMARVEPTSAVAQTGLGFVRLAQARNEEARRHFEEALRLGGKAAEAWIGLGLCHDREGRPAEAVAAYENALRLDPRNAQALNNLGAALAAQGRLDEAIERYRAALAIEPRFPDALQNLGNALLAKGDPPAAVKLYEAALALEPNRPATLCDLGAALLMQKRFEEAEAWLRKALAADPDDDVTRVNLGVALAETGRIGEAIGEAEEALRRRPDSARARAFLEHLRTLDGSPQTPAGS